MMLVAVVNRHYLVPESLRLADSAQMQSCTSRLSFALRLLGRYLCCWFIILLTLIARSGEQGRDVEVHRLNLKVPESIFLQEQIDSGTFQPLFQNRGDNTFFKTGGNGAQQNCRPAQRLVRRYFFAGHPKVLSGEPPGT